MEQQNEALDNISRLENDDDVRLRDIFEILNPSNQSPDLNGTYNPVDIQPLSNITHVTNNIANNLPQSASLPLLGQGTTFQQLTSQQPPQQQQHQQQQQQQQQQPLQPSHVRQHRSGQKPYINIVEQPAGKALRFRYECEGRSAGSIPGVNNTPENKTYPTIEIVGYKGEVVIVVSCVTKDQPYRPHPHKLVGKEGCKDGICSLKLKGDPMRAVFSNLGIQCVKRKEIRSALEMRERLAVDPFKTEFGHKDQPSSIDLNAVRLCFQAFITNATGTKSLKPVVSDPIYDKKAMSDLMICRLCSCAAKVAGGDEIILLCEKVAKDDIKVKFFEINNENNVIWEDFAEFKQTDIHKQTAIAFRTPRYHNTDIVDKAKVFLQLLRPSDGAVSEPLPFEYYPDPDLIKRKRLRMDGNPMNILRRELQRHEQFNSPKMQNDFKYNSPNNASNFWNFSPLMEIKPEPAMSPQHFGSHRSPYQMSPSPQPLSPMNRNMTPSPGLLRTPSAGSQTQMNELLNQNAMKDAMSIATNFGRATPTLTPLTTQQYNNNGNGNGNGNQFAAPLTPLSTNGNSPGLSNGYNPFMVEPTPRVSRMSGGSITPIWQGGNNAPESSASTSPFLAMNIPATDQIQYNQQQQHQQDQLQQQQQQYQQVISLPQQQQQQQQQQQFQQLPNDLGIITNNASLEDGPTLSGLLAMMDTDQLMPINSDDLKLSNLSITT